MHTVIFDLDGTLADTSRDLIAAANASFRRLGHGNLLDPVADAGTAFHGGRAMLTLGFRRLGRGGAEEVDTAYPYLLQYYGENIDTHTRLYPGARDAVEMLLSSGYRVGICTNKPADLAKSLLDRLGVAGLFGSMIGADTLPVRKPDPAPLIAAVDQAQGDITRSVLIGDTVTDVDTARAAGVPVVLVGFGPEGDSVVSLRPDAVLSRYEELPMLTARLIGRPD